MGNRRPGAVMADRYRHGERGVAVACEHSAPRGSEGSRIEHARSPVAARYLPGLKPEPVSSPGTSESGVCTCGGGCANPWMTHNPVGPINA
jgi:hypothetical protein